MFLKDVDARDKRGHDKENRSLRSRPRNDKNKNAPE